MTKSWKSTIGGAFSALGKTLMGIGILPQLSGIPSPMLTHVALAGFVCDGIGTFLGHLFAADATALQVLNQKVDQNADAVATGDTAMLTKRSITDK